MPQAKLGLFTAVGVTYALGSMKKGLGLYIALIGDFIRGEDVVKTGLADFYVKSEDLPRLEEELKDSICETTNLK